MSQKLQLFHTNYLSLLYDSLTLKQCRIKGNILIDTHTLFSSFAGKTSWHFFQGKMLDVLQIFAKRTDTTLNLTVTPCLKLSYLAKLLNDRMQQILIRRVVAVYINFRSRSVCHLTPAEIFHRFVEARSPSYIKNIRVSFKFRLNQKSPYDTFPCHP